ncbi:MAG TPA: methyltransferase domain-containing protein [Solirubrobacteraceae bacterium]|nr:methyltransferase domain-containing protein [Solirubrobacteraceae bacterium]
MADPVQLNLGAAKTFIPGFVNIDIHERAEVSLDLGTERLPFDSDSVSTVVSHHTLEHVPDYLFALSEIHRVLEHDGVLLLSLPYATLTEHHMVNPYHHHNFNEHSFDFFDPDALQGSAAEDGELSFRRVLVRFTYMGAFGILPRPLRRWSRRHLLNVVRQFDIALVAIKDPARPVETGPERARELERRIVELKRARTQYPEVARETEAARAARSAGAGAGGRRGALAPLRHRRDALLRRYEVRRD